MTPEVHALRAEERAARRAVLREFLAQATVQERTLLEARWFTDTPKPFTELAASWGVSKQCVQQFEKRMLRALRVLLQQALADAPAALDPAESSEK